MCVGAVLQRGAPLWKKPSTVSPGAVPAVRWPACAAGCAPPRRWICRFWPYCWRWSAWGWWCCSRPGTRVALYRRGDAYTYIRPQLLFAALGVAAMYAASFVDYHVWHRLAGR